ncbi:MAG: hypothetical protein LBM76_00645 [Mycoplasmataceae bacterium]|jgi:predicted O-methyltransferase YrrM|nr:hypothetical protein [Mycoplasmataceae bacterium]
MSAANNLLEEIKNKSIADSIPLLRDKTLGLFTKEIVKCGYTSVLEIGTAYGYSALAFSLIDCVNEVVSIERDEIRYGIAKQNLKDIKNINLVLCDAFNYVPNKKYDVILVDGPKSKQDILVTKYLQYLNVNGTMFIDNIFLKKFDDLKTLTKNQASLKRKVDEFKNWLIENKDFHADIIDIDDGVAIIKK